MSRFIFVLAAVLAVFSTSSSHRQCGVHEKYTSCGTACPLTCEEPYTRPCIKMCVSGCQCKKGFLKSATGACVLQQDCPVIWNP